MALLAGSRFRFAPNVVTPPWNTLLPHDVVVACENVLQVSQLARLPFAQLNGPDEVEPATDMPALPAVAAPPVPAEALAPPGAAPATPEPLPSLEQAAKQAAEPAIARAIKEALQATLRNIS